MRKAVLLIILCSGLIINFNLIYSQTQPLDSLNVINQSIETYRNREVTMLLRLKNIDYTMLRITFYDKDNIDVTYDIDRYEKNKRLLASMQNLHEGSRYLVIFTVREKDQNNMISGVLSEFKLYFIDKLP
jgi:hypothetical protein